MTPSRDHLPSELTGLAYALDHERDKLDADELEDIKHRATRGRGVPRRSARSTVRFRSSITALLATGLLMSSGGAALGVSALSDDLTSGVAQYGSGGGAPKPTTGSTGSGMTLGGDSTTTPGISTSPPAQSVNPIAGPGSPDSGPAGDDAPPPTDDMDSEEMDKPSQMPSGAAQPARQVELDQGELPFSGYLAIPLLAAGLGLLTAGLVLRRRDVVN